MTGRSDDRPAVWTLGLLAGGRSERMGRDKALARLNGRTMLEHVVWRCAPPTGEILVSSGPLDRRLDVPWPRVPDAAGAGPLAGIHALCAAVRTPRLVVVPCDMPYLERRYLEALVGALTAGRDAAFFAGDRGPAPLPLAVVASRALAAARALIGAGRLRVDGLAEMLPHAIVPPPAGACALTSVNHPEELDAAAKFFASLS